MYIYICVCVYAEAMTKEESKDNYQNKKNKKRTKVQA